MSDPASQGSRHGRPDGSGADRRSDAADGGDRAGAGDRVHATDADDARPDAGSEGASARFRRLVERSRGELRALMRQGDPVAPEDVAGALFRGWNGSRLTALVGARKFFKRFHEPDASGHVLGENVLARQNAIDSPWRPRRIGRAILPFTVLPPGAHPSAGWPHALVISYGHGSGRSRLNPVRRVVDYLVRPDAAAPGLLLGVSYFRLGRRRIFLEHFLIERVRVRPTPPSAA